MKDVNPTTLIPIISIATLSAILQCRNSINLTQKSEVSSPRAKYQIGLLICMQLAHILANANDNDNNEWKSIARDVYSQIIIQSYLPILLSIADSFLSMTAAQPLVALSFQSPRSRNKWFSFSKICGSQFASCATFFKYVDLKMFFKAAIPATIALLYATIWIFVGMHLKLNGYLQLYKDEDGRYWYEYYQNAAFYTSWVVTILHYALQRRRKMSILNPSSNGKGMQNYDLYHNHKSQSYNRQPEERCWEDWSTDQFLQWVLSLFKDGGDGNHSTSRQHSLGPSFDNSKAGETTDESDGNVLDILDILSSEKINGACLPFVRLDQLRSFGIAYGEAVTLIKGMKALMLRYPSRTGAAAAAAQINEGIDLDAWLGKKIREMPQPESHTETDADANSIESGTVNENAYQQDDVMDIYNNELASARAKAYMSREYGMELPDLRTTNDSSKQDAPASSLALSRGDLQSPTTPASAMTNDSDDGMEANVNIDQALLDAMPASVREIAKKRPDLVQALMQNKQEQVEAVALSRSNLPSISENDGRVPLEEFAGDEEYGNWNGPGGYNEETSGLLRRRRNAP